MMLRTLGLLLLAAEGALAQSREPSQWDANVTAYGGTVDGCPCTADCSPKLPGKSGAGILQLRDRHFRQWRGPEVRVPHQ